VVRLAGFEKLVSDLAKQVKERDSEIERLRAENAKLRAKATKYEEMLFALGAMDNPPCFCCGYNGSGYYQPDKHPCAERHHAARKEEGACSVDSICRQRRSAEGGKMSDFERWWESWLHGDDPDSIAARDAAAAAWRVRTDEIVRLRAEAESFNMDYRLKCDEETKAQAVEIERLHAENEALREDAKRLNYLDQLVARQQFISTSRPALMVGSDMHMGDGRCSLYIRDVFANVVNQGHADSVRAAIDTARKEEQ
jgi:cell division protein FtsB